MSDFRRFCFMYAFICLATCICNWLSLGKPLSIDSMNSTMFIASAAGALFVLLTGKKDIPRD